MGFYRSFSKFICFFFVLVIFAIIYVVILLRTYTTTVDSAQFDTSVDIFDRRQRIQQHKHEQLLKDYNKELKDMRAQEQGTKQSPNNNQVKRPSSGVRTNMPQLSLHGQENTDRGIDEIGINSLIENKGKRPMNAHTDVLTESPNPATPKPAPTPIVGSFGMEQDPTKRVLENIISSGNLHVNYTENVDSGSGIYNALWVQNDGPLLQRLTHYNAAIHHFRKELANARGEKAYQDLFGPLETLWCNLDDFHKELQKYPQVRTVSLAWSKTKSSTERWNSKHDVRNLLLQDYYEWTGSENLCRWVKTAGFTRAKWDAVYNRNCNLLSNISSGAPVNLETLYLHGKPINKNHYWPHHGTSYPKYFYNSTPPHVFYMHIVEDAVITKLGDVISGNLKLVPYSCSQDVGASAPPQFQLSPIYDEVFIMGQYWGDNFFHMMVENLPRIAPYLDFLKANPQIFIHAQATSGYTAKSLEILGLNRTRLIKGTARARRVFLSQATPCGFAHLASIQLLAHHYRNHLQTLSPLPQTLRRTLLLIRRSGSRKFTQHSQIQEVLETVAMEFDLDFELFIDNPSPAMSEAMVMFYRAALVVGPHGAGLSNLVYCRPGTLVIEGVCNPPHVNMCYQWTAHSLGLRYHGIGSRGGCETFVDVDYRQVAAAARELLQTRTVLKTS